MGSSLLCTEANRQELAERYLFGGMGRKEKQRFEEHLSECQACQDQLQQSRKMLNELKQAAENAGWSQKEIEQLSRLYAPRGVFTQFNWRLILAITAVLFIVFVLPFIWWANKPETKMRLMASLEPEFRPEKTLPQGLREAVQLHEKGEYEQAVNRLVQLAEKPDYQPFGPMIHRLIGLSLMLKKEPERALPYLQKSLADTSAEAEEKSLWYMANAYLMIGNKPGAVRFLEKVIAREGRYRERAVELLDRLKNL